MSATRDHPLFWSDLADAVPPPPHMNSAIHVAPQPGDVLLDTYLFREPQSLKRHRHLMRGGTYDPSKRDKEEFMRDLQASSARAAAALAAETPYTGPIQCQLSFYCSRPKAHFGQKRGQRYLRADAPVWNTNPKDVDNMAKFVLDALNGRLYADDRQIVQLECRKMYADPTVSPEAGYVYLYFRALPLDQCTIGEAA